MKSLAVPARLLVDVKPKLEGSVKAEAVLTPTTRDMYQKHRTPEEAEEGGRKAK